MIKARIEALIEREYLERDEGNMRVYKYLVTLLIEMKLILLGINSRDITGVEH
jgi:hypothetical protein